MLDRAGAFAIEDMVFWLVARGRELVVDAGELRHNVRVRSRLHGAHTNSVNFVDIGNKDVLHSFV